MPIRAKRDEVGDGHEVTFLFKVEEGVVYRQAQEDNPSSKWEVYARTDVEDGEHLAAFLQVRGFNLIRICGKMVWPFVHVCMLEVGHGILLGGKELLHRDVRGREFDGVKYVGR